MSLDAPVRYSPDLEMPEQDEAETGKAINDTLHEILETTSADYGHAVRSVHAKSHGLLEAEFTVADNLPPELAQGLFAQPGTYRAILRFSTNPGDILDDAISVPRGLAVKLIDVPGARLPGSDGNATQDFVMVNGPAFAAPDGKHFLSSLKPLAGTTDKGEGAKKALSAVLQATDKVLSTVGIESAKVRMMGGAPNVHPLGETYYSQTPFLYGANVAKFQIVPVSPGLTELTGHLVNAHDRPDALREDIAETMIEQDAVWEFRVQLQRDAEKQPIEDASVLWDEKDAPFVTVATLRAPHQLSWSHERARVVDDGLAFSVWHGLADHRPLGSINRLRRSAYDMSADYRGRFNGCPIHEPKALETLPA
jgi:hypothetical protein